MKRVLICMLILLLVGLCACAARKPAADETAGADTHAPSDSPAETKAVTEPEAASDPDPAADTDAPSEPSEAPSEPLPEADPARKPASLALPAMTTEDFQSFQLLDGIPDTPVSMQVPEDWTEDLGLWYCPWNGGLRKVLEPVCLLQDEDGALWEQLLQTDFTAYEGETEYLSATAVEAGGRDCLLVLGKSWTENQELGAWYPCFIYLRDPAGIAVMTYYFLDPEDASASAELTALIDSFRFE